MPRIAMISTAHIHSKNFLADIAKLTGAPPHIIWDDNEARGRAYAAASNCPYSGDLSAVVADRAIDGFVICAENTRHLPLLEKVLPAGKPTMCEKPLATSVSDARAIAQLARRHRAPLISGYMQPFFGPNRAAAAAVRQGALGKVTHANFRNAHHAAYARWFDSPELAWFAQPQLAGGGAMMDMGTHAVHLLRHLFGPVGQVWATCGNFSGQYQAVDDYGLMLLRFAGGVLGRVEAGWVVTGGVGGLEIIGSQKTLWNSGGVMVTGGPGQQPTPLPPAEARPDRIGRLLAVIAGSVTADELAEDLSACLDSVAIMAAAYASAASGQWVTVEAVE